MLQTRPRRATLDASRGISELRSLQDLFTKTFQKRATRIYHYSLQFLEWSGLSWELLSRYFSSDRGWDWSHGQACWGWMAEPAHSH